MSQECNSEPQLTSLSLIPDSDPMWKYFSSYSLPLAYLLPLISTSGNPLWE